MIITKKKHIVLFILISIIFILLTAYSATSLPDAAGVFWHREEIIVLLFVFAGMHCFLDISSMYDWIYKHRVLIAIGLLVFCVANCFTGSSVSMYETSIQPSYTSEYGSPIFGTARSIRSDEWCVNISRIIAGSYNNYGSVNNIVRGTSTPGISATGGLFFDYSALRSPDSWGYYLFGAEYGNSFSWSFKMIFGFLIVFELCMILTKKDKILSIFGSILIWFSTFNMWWSISTIMMSASAIIVLFYYTLTAENSKKRLLFGTMLAIAGSSFCCDLYPAWQVPFGWIIVSLMIGMIISNRNWKDYKKKDWLILVIDIAFMASIIIRYLYVNASYLSAVTSTVYPGARVSNGGFALSKLLGYVTSCFDSFKASVNPSESGTFFAVFPLGIILPIYVLFKEKGKNTLIWCLIISVSMLTLYCSFELPSFITKALLLTYSTPLRTVDIVGYGLVLLVLVSLSEMRRCGYMKLRYATITAAICILLPIMYYYGNDTYSFIKTILIYIILFISFFGILILIARYSYFLKKVIIIVSSLFLAIVGLKVNPITVGFSAITAKPIYSEIQSIISKSDKETLWITAGGNFVYSNYLICCGAPTLNSTNYIPNQKLWKILDPDNKNEKIWNRYAHINMYLIDGNQTEITLQSPDQIAVGMTYDNLIALNVDYIMAIEEIPESYHNLLEQLYSEDGVKIYRVL